MNQTNSALIGGLIMITLAIYHKFNAWDLLGYISIFLIYNLWILFKDELINKAEREKELRE
jgi:hypothetical protein